MRNKYLKSIISLSFIALMGVTSCANQGKANLLFAPEKTETFDYQESKTENFKKLSESARLFANKFSAKGYEKMYEDGNFVMSPISAYLALSLASEVTSGNTQTELLNALNIDYQTLKTTYKSFFESLNREYKTGQATLTNSVWLNTDVPFKDEALDSLATNYYCYSYSADFKNDNEEANKAIRHFISEKTKGLIDQDFNFSTETVFILLNTLYLKDTWLKLGGDLPFYKDKISFINSDKETITKDFLEGKFIQGKTYEEESFRSFYTETENGYCLKFIVPNDGYAIGDVFTEENIDKITSNSSSIYNGIDEENKIIYETRCIFPEFEATFDKDIHKFIREEFGVNDFFTDRCDFTPMTDTFAYCSEIRHVAKIKTDRKGIEGAAITAIVAAGESDGWTEYETKYEDFFVDRAFGFILEDTYGRNLFSGVIEEI